MSSISNHNLSKSPHKSNIWSNNEDKLKIIIRIRPVLNEQEETQFVQLQDHNTLQIKRPGNYTFMKFNNILPYYSTQKDVFNLLQDSVHQFLNGTNITIFAYGQTGAGKTYSIIGNFSTSPNISSSKLQDNDSQNIYHLLSSQQRGILSRSLEMIMQAIQNQRGQKVTISFYEIYNQKIFDLYNKQGSGALDIRQSKNGQISIPNLISIQITKIQEAVHYLMIGLKNRSTGSTHANAKSSRSHSIFQINLQKQGKSSSLRIVDLAGSQKFKIPSDITPAEKQLRIQQLTNINGSLSCLGHCISALIQKSRTHVPFRNSKLTRILSDSLLGQGKMRFIICISPSVSASAQTFSTLQFANRAKRAIFDRSQMRTPQQLSKKKSQNQEMVFLRKQLQKQRQLRISYEQQLSLSKKENIFLRIQNEKLQSKIKEISLKANLMTKSIAEQKKNSKSPRICYQQNQNENFQSQPKQNISHQQMLNLPIFQKNRNLIPNPSNSSCSASRNKSINVKKAEFQKKIRKFIEQSSPEQKQSEKKGQQIKNSNILQQTNNYKQTRNTENSKKNIQNLQKVKQLIILDEKKWGQQNESQNNFSMYNHKQTSSNSIYNPKNQQMLIQKNEDNEQQLDSLWEYQQEQTQQFFQRACEKMNMKEYQNLRQQMQKAKNQLLKFKHLDDQLQKKKISVIR